MKLNPGQTRGARILQRQGPKQTTVQAGVGIVVGETLGATPLPEIAMSLDEISSHWEAAGQGESARALVWVCRLYQRPCAPPRFHMVGGECRRYVCEIGIHECRLLFPVNVQGREDSAQLRYQSRPAVVTLINNHLHFLAVRLR